jgi:hypothetical protein
MRLFVSTKNILWENKASPLCLLKSTAHCKEDFTFEAACGGATALHKLTSKAAV